MGEQSGITSNTMEKILKKEQVPIEVLEKICGVFDRKLEDIVEIVSEVGGVNEKF